MPQPSSRAPKRKKADAPVQDSFGRLQPQELDFERVVLGALLLEKDAYSQVSEILKPESFYDPRHQLIFEAIRRLNIEQKSRPPISNTMPASLRKRPRHATSFATPVECKRRLLIRRRILMS